MSFRNMGEFRNALGELVEKAKANGRKRSRGRRNLGSEARPNGYWNWTADPEYAYAAFAPTDATHPAALPRGPIGKFTPSPLITTAGPYTPQIYPYGVEGVAGTYAVANSRSFKQKLEPRSKSLSTDGATWPVSDRKQALYAVAYMARGHGGAEWHAQYPRMVQKLAKFWPVEDERNRDIWTLYRRLHPAICRHADRVPTVAQLRKNT